MRALALPLLAYAVLASVACRRDPAASGDPAANARESGGVTATRVAGGVRLSNGTDRPVAYVVWNRGWLAQFAPCLDPGPGCVRLAAGASVVVPDAEIGGYAPGAPEAIVYWWHVVPDAAGGYRTEEVHEVVVRL